MRQAAAVLFTLITTAYRLPALEPPGTEVALRYAKNGLPVVKAEIGAESLWLALDTGTSRSLLSAGAAERLQLGPSRAFAVAWVGGAVRTGLCATGQVLHVGGLALAVPCLGWVPGEQLVAGTAGVDGLLGADALASVALLLDAPRGRVRLAPTGSLTPWVDGTVLPLERLGERAAVRVELPALGDTSALLVLDSGADDVVLFGEVARRAAVTAAVRRSAGQARSGSTSRTVRLVALGQLRLGGLSLEVGTAGLLPEFHRGGEEGLLPLRLLEPVLLDLSAGVLVAQARLRPTPSPPLLAASSGP